MTTAARTPRPVWARLGLRCGIVVTVLGAALGGTLLPGADTAGATPGVSAVATASVSGTTPTVGRVLVIALPHLTWADLRAGELPNLRSLIDDSAVANLSERTYRIGPRAGEAYATIGAGTRALAPQPIAGLAFGPEEPLEADNAADTFARRTGHPLDGAAGQVAIAPLTATNVDGEYEAVLGSTGDALEAAGVTRGVVANADTSFEDTTSELFHREAALSLMDSTGIVQCGQVDRGLLEANPDAAFGLRLANNRVVQAFDRCWKGHTAVLVEASDLRRAADYAPLSSAEGAARTRAAALARTDQLVGKLLHSVDLERDAVIVVSTAAPDGGPHLGVMAVHAPGWAPGWLTSGTTRRTGIVAMTDVGPTILALSGAERPESMDGRAVAWRPSSGTAAARLDDLVRVDTNASFRDGLLGLATWVFVLINVALAGAYLWATRGGRRPRVAPVLRVGALAVLTSGTVSFLAAPLNFSGAGALFLFILGGALVLGALFELARRREWVPLELALGFTVVVPIVSAVFLDSRLQLSTIFGNSPIIGGRFSGINNTTMAFLYTAAVLLAALVVPRLHPRARLPFLLVFFGVVFVADGAPMWGSDVGGLLVGIPILAVTGMLLLGLRIRWRTVLFWVVGTAAVVIAAGAWDLSRPADEQTHLGRLLQRIGGEGSGGFWTVIQRKWDSNVSSSKSLDWWTLMIVVVLFVGWMWWRRRGEVRALFAAVPGLGAGLVGVLGVITIGTLLNDSGTAVPGTSLMIALPACIYLLVAVATRGAPDTADPPDPPGESGSTDPTPDDRREAGNIAGASAVNA